MILEIIKSITHGRTVKCECDYCKKLFSRGYALLKNNENQFCSKDCYYKYHSGNYLHSTETKLKMSLSSSGINNSQFGKKHTQKELEKMAASHLGIKKSPEEVERMRLARLGVKRPDLSGSKNPAWKGGVTSIYRLIRNSIEINQWRTSVFERDNYTCQKCGVKNGNGKAIYLNAHHIKAFSLYPELRFEVDNGITYCKDCHQNSGLHKRGEYANNQCSSQACI